VRIGNEIAFLSGGHSWKPGEEGQESQRSNSAYARHSHQSQGVHDFENEIEIHFQNQAQKKSLMAAAKPVKGSISPIAPIWTVTLTLTQRLSTNYSILVSGERNQHE
jgi:hypothetical protein